MQIKLLSKGRVPCKMFLTTKQFVGAWAGTLMDKPSSVLCVQTLCMPHGGAKNPGGQLTAKSSKRPH